MEMVEMKFMKPLIHGFLHDFSLPVSFLKQLESELVESMVLTTDEHPHCHWPVKLQGGRHFSHGWMDFCVHHCLQVGDFLVFTLKTHFVFQVSVYDPLTACQRHLEMIPLPNHCLLTITTSCIKNSMIHLPRQYIRSSGLPKRHCFVKLLDEKDETWIVKLCRRSYDGDAYFSQGWKNFVTAHNFRPRSIVDLQLIKTGRTPTLKCSLLTFPPKRARKPSKA
ncbi:hypothetical protein RND81_08G088700 [Saponaria officinalis]|uniref:TF-B3 domain-containing protein n=1 Tax=Saponaria officinalis TaxID=3572 RepID=A0AAW1J5D9_SAPOF